MLTFNRAGNTYLAFGMENPSVDVSVGSWGPRDWGATELNLYNITQGKYEYEKVVVNPDRDTRVIKDIILQGDSLYFRSSNYIHCYEAMTGKELWRIYRGPSTLDSPMILAGGKLFTVHDYGFLYCSDARKGDFLWSIQDTDTPLELSYLNGVLYYLGAREGILHAVDANSGNHLWRISPPDRNLASPLRGTCTAVEGRNSGPGVVVITTGQNVFAYQAIR
jgi:outer membrane protein assembly factor BamB